MKYAAIVLSKATLQECVDNFWDFRPDEIDQIRKALHAIKLEERYEQTPSGLTPWGEPMSQFNKTLGRESEPTNPSAAGLTPMNVS